MSRRNRVAAGGPVATLSPMPKKSRKPADLNRLAAAILDDATDETAQEPESPQVRSGREGGAKGGQKRAETLSPERRTEIARAAAEARWERS